MKFLSINKILFILTVTILLSSCSSSLTLISNHPNWYDNRVVTVKGTVVSSLLLEDIKIYTIKNKSEKTISIVSNGYVPMYQEKVKVKGILNTAYKYKKMDKMTVVNEVEYFKRKAEGKISKKSIKADDNIIVYDSYKDLKD